MPLILRPVSFHDDELTFDDSYEGYPLMTSKGPFVKKYLNKIIDVVEMSLDEHPRTFAFRIDLRFPSSLSLPEIIKLEKRLIERFIASLRAKVRHARNTAKRTNPKMHRTNVRYLCTREIGEQGRPHYHLVIFLNRDAFNTLGKYSLERNNLYSRLIGAWESALGLESGAGEGLVNIPVNAVYQISADDADSQNKLFHRASYMAKAATKMRGNRHCFSGSRCTRKKGFTRGLDEAGGLLKSHT